MWIAMSFYAGLAYGQPVLTVNGTCPGPLQVDMLGLTPGGTVAAIHGDAPGADAIPGGAPSCGGTLTGLSRVKLYTLLDDTDNDGNIHLSPNAPTPQCGRFVQLVDLASCQTSNVLQLLTGTCEVSGRMALIPGGTFQMGSPVGEVGQDFFEDQHQVTLTRSYCLDKTEVTQEEFEAVAGFNPMFPPCADCPVGGVSWNDAAKYANRLSVLEGLTSCYSCTWAYIVPADYNYPPYWGWECTPVGSPYACDGYRLPTEAEWERAARGGLVGASFPNGGNLIGGINDCTGGLVLSDGSLLDDVAWYCGNSGYPGYLGRPVAQLAPNAYGLSDMSGNAWEWCHDWAAEYDGDAIDPFGPPTGFDRVIRSGGTSASPRGVRVADRDFEDPPTRASTLGLRLARSNP